MSRRLTVAALLVALAGCSTPPPPPAPLDGIPEHRLAVSTLDVADAYAPPGDSASFIDRRHTGELAAATRQYLSTRLIATGGEAVAQASIVQASIVEEPRQPSGKLGAPIVREPDADLHGIVEVRVGVADAFGKELGFASARVERRRSVLEMTPVLERDRMAGEMIRQLMVDLDEALDRSMRENLGIFLKPPG
ncbi:MAG: hypothetical protein U1E14_02840 [Geminicoccaceae bacterium]